MEEKRAKELLRELDDGWHLNSEAHLERVYRVQNFVQAMAQPSDGFGECCSDKRSHFCYAVQIPWRR